MSAYYNEFDPYPAQWLRNLIAAGLIADGEVDERSIVDVRAEDLASFTQCHFFAGLGGWSHALRLAGWPDDRPVWTGSCPCQPFSAAGTQGGINDKRHLWPELHRLIEECSPSIVFGEQVASKAGLAWLDLVSADLEGAGYAVGAADLCAAGIGAPHIRQRLWWGAERLDDTTGARHVRQVEGPEGEARHEAWLRVPGAGCGSGGLEHPGSSGLSERERDGRVQRKALDAPEREAAECGRHVGGLVDTNGRHPGAEGLQRGGEYGQFAPDRRAMSDGGAGADHGLWRDADWLRCRDGRWRPVESGTFPLAHGLPGRVGRLRAYGNAIVPQVAAQFIEAFMGRRP